MANVYPVIMCGGAGTRLWPASRPKRAKQFVKLIEDKTLFEATLERTLSLDGFERLIIVAGKIHAKLIHDQMSSFDIEYDLLLEPAARDSGPAVALAALHVAKLNKDGVCVMIASDHHIINSELFCDEIEIATRSAEEGSVFTLGICPRKPSTAYGYVKPENPNQVISKVEEFVEKPDFELAKTYIDSGYLWNSGNFIARASVLIDEFKLNAPEMLKIVENSLLQANPTDAGIEVGDIFLQANRISVDYAIMEKTKNAKVLRSEILWSDLGTWSEVKENLPQDSFGNAVLGNAELINTRESLVRNSNNQLVVLANATGLSVIVEEDVIFINHLANSQDVKSVISQLKENNRAELDRECTTFKIAKLRDTLRSWFFVDALPFWWCFGFDHENMLWVEKLSLNRDPTSQAIRARVQPRQTYVYATAHQLGWQGPAKQAFACGLHAIEQTFGNGSGLMSGLLDRNAQVVEEVAVLYDQTFTLLALAKGYSLSNDCELKALKLLEILQEQFSNPNGSGFCESIEPRFQANPHMHLFEACIEWMNVCRLNGLNDEPWMSCATKIADLCQTCLVDHETGFLQEFFQDDWLMTDKIELRIIEPGHQFEWAWLLVRFAKLVDEKTYIKLAEELFALGLKGYDTTTGVVVSQLNYQGEQISKNARFWHQIEWFKACLILLERESENTFYQEQAQISYRAVKKFLDHPVNGLWFDKIIDGELISESAPASTFYHLASMIEQIDNTTNILDEN